MSELTCRRLGWGWRGEGEGEGLLAVGGGGAGGGGIPFSLLAIPGLTACRVSGVS